MDLIASGMRLFIQPVCAVGRFGFIGSPLPCLNACTAQGASNVHATPNYNAEADGMASIISHEAIETVTDPLINAWYASLYASSRSLLEDGMSR